MACVNEKRLVCGKASLLSAVRKVFYKKETFLFCEKGLFFQLMQSQPIKKNLFSARKNFNFPLHPN